MEEKEMKNGTPVDSKRRVRYIVTAVFFLAAAFICCLQQEIFQQETAQEIFGTLSNAFFIAGVLFAGIGGISRIAAGGGYDIIGYSVSNFSLHHLIPTRPKEKYTSFYEYKKAKDEKGRGWLPHVFFVGLFGIAVSAVFLAVYYCI